MADNNEKVRGPYLQYLSDSSTRNVPRTTKYRWDKKAKLMSEREESCPEESSLTKSPSPSCQRNEAVPGISTSSFSPDDFQSPEPNYINAKMEVNSFSNSGDEFETERVEELMSMSDDPALFTDFVREDDRDISYADDFPDVFEMLGEKETDGKNSDEESDNDSESSDDNSNRPLYPGCRLSLGISMLLVVTFCVRHALSGVALADLLTLIELHCLLPNQCAKSTKLLREFFGKLKSPLELHYYCSFCQEYFGTQKPSCCSNAACLCDFEKKRSELCYFIVIPFINQLQAIIRGMGDSAHEILHHRTSRKKKCKHNIEDIFDGELYRNHFDPQGYFHGTSTAARGKEIHLSLMVNTDGVSIFRSSNYSLWPVYFVINELPPEKRFSTKYRLFAGLWFGRKKPDFRTFLQPFVNSLHGLFKEGEQVTFSDGSLRIIRCILLCGSFDAPAKCLFQNMSQFNGTYGCPYCLHPGETVKTSERGHTRAYPFHIRGHQNAEGGKQTNLTARTIEKRTHEQTLLFAKEADNLKGSGKDSVVKGVKGMTWSMVLPGFDIINGVTIDYMHCVLLGITKMLLTLWTEKSYSSNPWYLGSENVKKLEQRYLDINPPNVITRTPRSLLKNLAHFKASELRSFLLYYALPCLWGLLEEVYFQHLVLLVDAIYLLLQDSISPNDVESSSSMLLHFCTRMEALYGRRYETYNVHMLLHLPDCVRHLGPLWGTSCFWFEGYNGDLTKLFHGTQNVDIQITHAVCIHQKIPELTPLLPAGSAAKSFYKHLVEGRPLPTCREEIAEKVYAIGSLQRLDLDPQTSVVVKDLLGEILTSHKFKRLWKHGTMFQCSQYHATTKRNSYTVQFTKNGTLNFGELQFFLKCFQLCEHSDRIHYIAILKLLEPNPKISLSKDKFTNAMVNHIVPVKKAKGAFVAVPVMDIISMCVSVNISDSTNAGFVCKLPNRFEKD